MSKRYEHLHVDLTPWACGVLADILERGFDPVGSGMPADVQYEVQNFINECRARVQHAEIGMPDRAHDAYIEATEKAIAELPAVRVEESWLDT